MSERLTDAAIREAMAREPIAFEELMRVTGMGNWWCRRGEIRAHIPADKERDTDLVIGASLQDVPALAAEALARGEDAEGLRAEVARLNGVIDRVRDTLGRRDGIEPEAQRAVARAEAAEAEVERLRAEREEARTAICETHNPAIGTDPADWIRMLASDLATARAANAVRASALPEDAIRGAAWKVISEVGGAWMTDADHEAAVDRVMQLIRAALAAKGGAT